MNPKIKINFIIAGAQKCGTTALYECLTEHPSIFMPKKEIHYFDNKLLYQNDIDYSIYHSFFSEHHNQKALGEATPIYIYWNGALERIKQYNKKIKIIVILRNPIERAFSHWNMERNRGNENSTFLEAIMYETQRCAEALPEQHRVYSYVDRGHYINQLRKLWDTFNKEQTLIINSNQLKYNQRETVLEIHKFLDIKDAEYKTHKTLPPLIAHEGVYTHTIPESARAYLKEVYSTEIKELEAVLGWDCSDWLT